MRNPHFPSALRFCLLILVCVAAAAFGARYAPGLFSAMAAASDIELRGPSTIVLRSAYDIEQSENARSSGRSTTLATADFNRDGFPDIISGSGGGNGGAATVRLANSEAFAPTEPENIRLAGEGRFRGTFAKDSKNVEFPAWVDFLAAGDFDGDAKADIAVAGRGDTRFFVALGNGKGDFAEPVEFNVPGPITSLSAGDTNPPDTIENLVIASGTVLTIFESGINADPSIAELPFAIRSISHGDLDDNRWGDLAILSDSGVYILHGENRRDRGAINAAARLEKVTVDFEPVSVALGEFIWDRDGRTEIAMLREDGTVGFAALGNLDTRPFTAAERQDRRRRQNLPASNPNRLVRPNVTWRPSQEMRWNIADELQAGDASTVNAARSASAPQLFAAHLSGQVAADLVVIGQSQLKVFPVQTPEKVNGEDISHAGPRSEMNVPATGNLIAALSIRTGLVARPGLVYLKDGGDSIGVVPSAPTAVFDVDRTDDSLTSACTAAANDCSLRGAISAANTAPGIDTVNVPAGTYTLTLANAGGLNEDANATGDLDVLDDLILNGAAAATTIIQAGTTNSNGIDKVMGFSPFCNAVNGSISGVTMRFGNNTQPDGSPDFSHTGGGMDVCTTGATSLNVTNAVFDQNTVNNSYGGGINLDSLAPSNTTQTISGTSITGNDTVNSGNASGGGININGDTPVVQILNATISGNRARLTGGDGVGGGVSLKTVTGGSPTMTGSNVSNNNSASSGGGIANVTSGGSQTLSISNTIISGNTSNGNGAGTLAEGGGFYHGSTSSGAVTLTELTVTGNTATIAPAGGTHRGGGGLFFSAINASATLSHSRIVGNTATNGSGLRKDNNAGLITATNNWWGCSSGPAAAPCDIASLQAAPGVLTSTPFLQLRTTAVPTTVVVGQTSALTTSFTTNSAGAGIAVANLDALIGLPVAWSAVNGAISSPQLTIQPSGTATATYTGTTIGAGSATAVVDAGPASGSTNTVAITVNQANTTTTITADTPDPSIQGQAFTVSYTVAPVGPGTGTPTGNVTVSDGVDSCVGTVAAGSCSLTLNTVGARTLTAVYAGDTNFVTSTSAGEPHQVNPLTTISITDVTVTEGNGGTVVAVFNINLSAPAPVGGVTFDVTTADGTAIAPIDYATNSVVGQTIAGGGMASTFSVTVNGDTAFEPDEIFFANLSNVTPGITVADGSAIGRITNDDAIPAGTFCNLNQINIPSGLPATTYGVTIPVSGLTGVIKTLTVDINGLTSPNAQNMQFLLVSPTGENFLIMASAGGALGISSANYRIDDAAADYFPRSGSVPSGSYRAGHFTSGSLPAPAPVSSPASPYIATLTSARSLAPNGNWTLYVNDVTAGGGDNFVSGGACVNFTTASAVSPPFNTVFSGSLAAGDAQQTGRMNRFAVISLPTAPKAYPGDFTTTGARFYDSYTVTNNSGTTQPVLAALQSGCGTAAFDAAYLGSFNPTNLGQNYLSDPGSSPANLGTISGFNLAPGATAVFVVHEVNPGTGCASYGLRVEGALNAPIDDFGDAPTAAQSGFVSSYPTLLANNGASHVAAGPRLGATRDTESDGQPNATATGDGADEDGVVIPTLVAGTNVTVTINATTGVAVPFSLWIDYNRDGDWNDPGEQPQNQSFIGSGANSYVISVPLSASPGTSFARVRIASAAADVASPTGAAADGEVEDHQVTIAAPFDFGDAPTAAQSGFASSYPTLLADNGARHVSTGPTLGATRDFEPDGQPNVTASGDGADEDGVTIPASLPATTTQNITVNASANTFLNAWIDWNRDGDWGDASEQVATNLALLAGNNSVPVTVPAGASVGTSLARFRLTSASIGGPAPTGAVTDGEVEDYQVTIAPPPETIVTISGGNVTVTDSNGGTSNDDLRISCSGANLVLNDPTNTIFAGPPPAVQVDANTVNIPLASVTGTITVNHLDGSDLLTVTSAGCGAVPTGLTYNAGTGNDTLTINNPAGGLFAPAGGIDYNGGGQPGDNLNLLGGGGAAYSETYFVGTTTPPIGGGPGNNGNGLLRFAGPTSVDIRFTGLAPIVDTVAAGTLTINSTDAANAISVSNGTAPRLLAAVDAFETIEFANKTNVVINGGDGAAGGDAADNVLVSFSNTGGGLASLTVNGDEGADLLNLTGSPATVTTTLNGGASLDLINVGNTGALSTPGLLTPVAGPVVVNGDAGGADLVVDGSGAAVAADYAISATTVTRSTPVGFGGVTYATVSTLLLETGSGVNVITVNSTAAAVSTFVNTRIGTDTVNVLATNATGPLSVNPGADNDVVNIGDSGTLDNVLGSVFVVGASGLGDILNINDQADVNSMTYTVTGTTVARTGAATITYDTTSETLNINSGSASDGINLNSTSVLTNVNSGGGDDSINFANGVTLNGGLVDGGANTDTIDYSAYATSVAVNLGIGTTGLAGDLDGLQENPPQSTVATGTATYTYNFAAKTFDMSVTVSNLAPASVTAFHIHRNHPGVNGPIIVGLDGLFGLGSLIPSGSGFTFNATNIPLPPQHEAAFLGGVTYLNFHTAAAPGGLIRGQIFSNANQVITPGTGTGTAGVSNVENINGGSAADSLVGSSAVNLLNGNAGNDTILGGPGADTMNGGNDNDAVIWSNGDGSDIIDGNVGTSDVVQVNGSVTAADVFTVGAGAGGRIAFARTSPGPFALDIGTSEALILAGVGNNDSMTVNSLAGVAGLTSVGLFGFGGDDTFNVIPDSNASVRIHGGVPVAPTLPGDTIANIDFTGVTGLVFTPDITVAGSGGFTFTNRQPVSFVSIETYSIPTTTTVTSSVNPSVFGQNVTFTATVTSSAGIPAGMVTFLVDGTPVCTGLSLNPAGQATCLVTNLSVGSHVVTANYAGSYPFAPSSGTLPGGQVVNKASSNVTVLPTINPTTYGQTLTMTATLTAVSPGAGIPQGTVAFTDGANPIVGCGAAVINPAGSATCTTAVLPAGNNKVITATYAGDANFNGSAGSSLQTILKAALNVTASSHGVTYGDPVPAVNVALFAVFVLGENSTALTTQPTCTTTYTATSPVGVYPTSCAGGVSNNYNFNYIPGQVVVSKKGLTVAADAKTRGYGVANPALTATLSGFIAGDTPANSTTGSAALSTTATISSGVGTYPITVAIGSLASTNYSFGGFTPALLTVTAAPLVVTADNKSRVFGAANPAFTFTVTGFTNGEGTSVLSGSPSMTTTATATSAPGNYPITITQNTLANSNYTFSFVNGTLTVSQAATTTVITNAAALAANATPVGQAYAVNWSVTPVAPGAGTPTGTVLVSDGANTCSAAVGTGTCSLTSTTVGAKTITAVYSGDANFAGSSATAATHTVVIAFTGNVKQFIAFGTNTNLAGVTMTLTNTTTNTSTTTTTDAGGNYSFGSLTLGQNYTITPSGLGKVYEATSRTYTNVNTNVAGGDFIAYDQPGPNAIPRSVRAVSQTVTAGSPVTVPILMTTTGVETRVAFSVEFTQGPLGIPSVACGSGTVGCTVAFDNTQPGRYGITITPASAIAAGSREIARVTFPTSATTLTSTPVRFGDIPTAKNVRNSEGNPLPVLYWTDGTISFTGGTVLTGATITGRVTTPSGQGLRNAQVVLLDTVGNRSIATTGSFGNYTFEGLELGRDYMVTVVSRRYRFAPRTVNLTGNLTGFDLVGLE